MVPFPRAFKLLRLDELPTLSHGSCPNARLRPQTGYSAVSSKPKKRDSAVTYLPPEVTAQSVLAALGFAVLTLEAKPAHLG